MPFHSQCFYAPLLLITVCLVRMHQAIYGGHNRHIRTVCILRQYGRCISVYIVQMICKKELGPYFYMQRSMQNRPTPSLCRLEVLDCQMLATCFFYTYFYFQLVIIAYESMLILRYLFHNMMTKEYKDKMTSENVGKSPPGCCAETQSCLAESFM